MTLIIKNISLLYGKELSFINRGFVCIDNSGIIIDAGGLNSYKHNPHLSNTTIYDGEGLLVIPGFINAHTHIADSIGKDAFQHLTFNKKIHPVYGIKQQILGNSEKTHIKFFISNSLISMLKKGIVAFADFREGGYAGIELLHECLNFIPLKSVILGRVEHYFDLRKLHHSEKSRSFYINKQKIKKFPTATLKELSAILQIGDGLGISGTNENTDTSLKQYRTAVKTFNVDNFSNRKKLVAIHVAESKDTVRFSKQHTGKTEVERAVSLLHPDVLVHMTHANTEDLRLAVNNNIGIVICPRSNGLLGTGIPDVPTMLKLGCKISVGTDNIMVNSPDLLRELDYLWKIFSSRQSQSSAYINPRDLLKMITVNPGDILNLNSGSIENGKDADLLFIDKFHIDLQPIHDIYSSIIHRLPYDAIKTVMIKGRFLNDCQI